jgi:hypothetical protein
MSGGSTSRPVLILGGIAAGALVLSNGLPPLTPPAYDWVGPAIGLVGLTITAAVTFITQGKVTPTENVEVRRVEPADGGPVQLVAGEGSEIPTGAPVDVTPATHGDWTP